MSRLDSVLPILLLELSDPVLALELHILQRSKPAPGRFVVSGS